LTVDIIPSQGFTRITHSWISIGVEDSVARLKVSQLSTIEDKMSRKKPAITTVIADRPMITNARNKFIFFERSLAPLEAFLDLGRCFSVNVVVLLAREDNQWLPRIRQAARFGRDDMAIPMPGDHGNNDQARIL
jgi:hypothetical protein